MDPSPRAADSSPAEDQGASRSSPAEGQGAVGSSLVGRGCWVQPLWSHPIVGASHLSAADGAVAVACSDGMLLLLDQATGQLIR